MVTEDKRFSRRVRMNRAGMLFTAAAFVATRGAAAASTTYTGPNSGSFAAAANWSTHTAPNSGDDVYVGAAQASGTTLTVDFDYGAASYSNGGFNSLTIDPPDAAHTQTELDEEPARFHTDVLNAVNVTVGLNGSAELVQSGIGASMNTITGTLTLAYNQNSSGEYLLENGSLSAAAISLGFGAGELNQIGGTILTGGIQNVAGATYFYGGTATSATGLSVGSPYSSAYTLLNGGSLTIGTPTAASADAQIAGLNDADVFQISSANSQFTDYGGMEIGYGDLLFMLQGEYSQSAGSATIVKNVTLGNGTGGTGSLTVSGGTLTIEGSLYAGGTSTSAGGAGLVALSSADVTIYGALNIWNSSGTTVSLSSGTLQAGSLITSGNPALFAWTGGTLHITNQILDFTSAADSMAPFGQSLTLNSGQTLIADDGENLMDAAVGIELNGGNNNTESLLVSNTSSSAGNAQYQIYAGTLTAAYETIGEPGQNASGYAELAQYGGTNNVQNLTVSFSGAGAYYLSAGALNVTSTLTVGGNGQLLVNNGTLFSPVTENDGYIAQFSTGEVSLGAVTGAGYMHIGYPVGSTCPVDVTSIRQQSVTLQNTGKLTIDSNSTPVSNVFTSLSIIGNGILDLTNNKLIINYGSGADPISSITAWIASGYNGGAWNGVGIDSTMAAANSGSYGIGYADYADAGNPAGLSSGQIEIMYTLLGDANLDGKVNGTDFNLMAANFNQSVTNGWDEGDFNYDGKVNGNDFVLLADNFNQFASQSAVSAADQSALDSFAAANGISLTNVPEPTSAAIFLITAMGLLQPRFRSKKRI